MIYAQPSFIRKASPTPSDLHVDRLLTEFAVGYRQDMNQFVADRVFPIVPVDKQGGKYATYEKADFFRQQLKKRAPLTPAAEVRFRVNTDNTYFCEVLAGKVPVSAEAEANADQPFTPEQDGTYLLQQQALLEREIEWASKFLIAGAWGTDKTPSTLWSAADSTPLEDIEVGIKTVLTNTGFKPNRLVLGYDVWSILKNHAEIVERVKYGQTPGNPAMVTPQAIAALTGIEQVLIMEAIKNTAAEGKAASMSFVAGKNALVVYAAPRPSKMLASGGYIFTWRGLLGANALGGRVSSWYEQNVKGNMVELEMAYDMKKIASDVGYFFDTPVA